MNETQMIYILLIEDDALDRMAVERAFRAGNLPYTLEFAETAAAAQERLGQGGIDLVLLDQSLPDGTGLELQGQMDQIPTVFLTGAADANTAVQAMKAGAYDYLVKDTARDYLLLLPITIENALKRKRDEDELARYRLHLEEEVQLRTVELQKANKHLQQEITERVRTEEALRESEEKYRQLVNLAQEGIWVIDKDSFTTFVNPSMAKMLGYSADEMMGKRLFSFMDERGVEIATRNVARRKQGITEQHDFEFLRKDGNRIIVTIETAPMMDEDGNYAGAIAGMIDITARVRAEEALRQLNKAIEHSPVSVMITDTKGVIQYVNPKFSQVTGYSAAEAIGQTPRILQSGEHPPEVYRELWDAITAGGEWRGEFHNKKKNGDLYWSMASIAGVKDQSDNITHYVAVEEDITERKQLEEEHVRQERLAAVGQLAAGIAHDFNNVMAVITLYSELLQRSENLLKNDLKKLQIIYQQAMHAADLTRQILDFSRRSVREPRPLDLKLLLNEMLKFVERTISERIQVQFAFSSGDYMVNADLTQLQQAVTNLTVNARDAMPQGGALYVNLSRSILRADETPPCTGMAPGEWIKLAVTDTGTGIAPDVLPHIFEPFFTTKEVGKGTGLGLAQVYGIVQQHEGCITVKSRLGEGTTFTIYLPALVTEADVKTAELLTGPLQGQGETILLVEDNQILLEATRSVLESLNYRVLTAVDGQDALTVYRTQPNQINLVLADVVMPKMDGFEMVKALQQQFPPPKVLLMSGFPRDTEMKSEMKQFVSDWLPKPLNIDQLARFLREALT